VLGEDGTGRPADPVHEDVQYIQYSTVPPQSPGLGCGVMAQNAIGVTRCLGRGADVSAER
jgi:hypothetical protein